MSAGRLLKSFNGLLHCVNWRAIAVNAKKELWFAIFRGQLLQTPQVLRTGETGSEQALGLMIDRRADNVVCLFYSPS